MPVVREIAAPPDVERLARRLRDAPGLAVLRSDPRGALHPRDARFSFLACSPVEHSQALVPPFTPSPRAPPGWAGFAAAPRWVGVLPYEALRAPERARGEDPRLAPSLIRPSWIRYGAVARVDHVTGRVAIEADHAAAATDLERRLLAPDLPALEARLRPAEPQEPLGAHAARVRRALAFIGAGDVYQVNLARRLRFTLRGDPLDAFHRMMDGAPAPYGFFVRFPEGTLAAVSPELALEVNDAALRTGPIKGTRPRGDDAASDRALALALDRDPKERAELTMAIDLHRNDLGRIAQVGSVRVLGMPRVLASTTVWSRVSEVRARRVPGASLDDVVRAALPCGSVTGAPKGRAMQIIAALEPDRRGAYTGAFGYLGRDGRLVLAVAIRTLEVDASRFARDGDAPHEVPAFYGTGGGIVAESDPDREVDETGWKARPLASLVAPR